MRDSTLLPAFFALLSVASTALAGCGGRSGLEVPDQLADGGVILEDGAIVYDTGAPIDDSSGGVCVPACQTDLECQLSCSALPVGQLNCCDRRLGACYQYEGSACPRGPRTDGGVQPPY